MATGTTSEHVFSQCTDQTLSAVCKMKPLYVCVPAICMMAMIGERTSANAPSQRIDCFHTVLNTASTPLHLMLSMVQFQLRNGMRLRRLSRPRRQWLSTLPSLTKRAASPLEKHNFPFRLLLLYTDLPLIGEWIARGHERSANAWPS